MKFYDASENNGRELQQRLDDATLEENYPAPPAADTFNYELEYNEKVIRWNQLSQVPTVLRDLEKWFGK